jgi:nitrate/nitrite-specific signal transduction histidine kinase
MQLWYLTPSSISYLAQFVLTLTIATYLAQLAWRLWKQKTEWLATAFLAGFFAGWTTFSLLSFLTVSLHPGLGLVAMYWQTPAVSLGLVFLLQFVYRFPPGPPTLVWESRIVLGLSLLFLLRESAYAVERLTLLADWNVQYRLPWFDYVLALEFLWVFVVDLRQTVRASNHAHRAFVVRHGTKWSAVLTRLRSAKFTVSAANLSLTTNALTRLRSAASLTTNAITNALRALLFPHGRPARAARDFAIIFLAFFLLSGLQLAQALALIPDALRQIGLSLFALIALFASALLYLNALPETTTLMTKLVGVALVTILSILGAVGWLLFPHELDTATVDAPFRQKQTLRFAPNARGGYDARAVPFAFETDWGTRLERGEEGEQQRAVQLPFAFPFYGHNWRTAYVLDNGTVGLGRVMDWKDVFYDYGPTPAIFPLFLDLIPAETSNVRVFAKSESERLTLTWDRVPGVNLQNTFTFQLVLYPDGMFDITFRDIAMRVTDLSDLTNPSGIIGAVPGAGRPVQHVNLATDLPYSGSAGAGVVDNLYLRVRDQIHQPLVPLAYLVVASALLVVIGFPVFLHQNLVQPLDALLAGVKRVNAGDLEARTPVQFPDEIGFLTESFNAMTESLRAEHTQLRQATEELRGLTVSLEARVAERTRELSALYDVSAIATRAQELELLLREALTRTMLALGCEVGAILLVSEKKSPAEPTRLRIVAHQGFPPALPMDVEMTPAAHGLFAQMSAERQPVRIADASTDPRVPTEMHVLGSRALLIAPLLVEEQMAGLVSLLRDVDKPFKAEESALLATVSDQLSTAVTSQRLRQIAQQSALLGERQRLARDLHDSVTQALYGVTLFAQASRSAIYAGNLSLTSQYVERLSETARQALKEMRLLIFELRPSLLDQVGFVGALQQRMEAVERRAGVAVEFKVEGITELPAALENDVYQIAQESLNNILKHSGASWVALRLTLKERNLHLQIADDGRGFDPAAIGGTAGIGFASMRERAGRLGGQLQIESKPGAGTRVSLTVPVLGD